MARKEVAMIEVILLKIVLLAKLCLGLGKTSMLWAGKVPLPGVNLAVALSLVLTHPFFPSETFAGALR
jgi:hypothetical protein